MNAAHIFMVTHYFPAHGGGIERVAGHLAKGLVQSHGFTVTWMASSGDAIPSLPDGAKCLAAPAWNVTERRLGIPYPMWSFGAYLQMWREIRNASLVYVHDYLYAGSVAACLFTALQGKPVVITQHIGLVPYRSRLLRGVFSALNRTLGAWMLRRATRVVFESNAVRDYFRRFVCFPISPLTIPNGLDVTLFRPASVESRSALRLGLDIAENQLLFLFVGRFVEKKGLHVLKELAGRLKDCYWLFVGHGQLHPAAWGLPNVRVLDPLSPSALVPLYQAADLLVLPSKGEGFPLVVQEAMACGTPAMVGLDTAAASDFEPGLVLAADAEGVDSVRVWHARITELAADRRILAEMRSRVAVYAHATWSWKKCASAYANRVFTPLVESAKGSAV